MRLRSRERTATVRRVVIAHLPWYQIGPVLPIGEGLENVAYEVNGELIARFSKEPDPASRAVLVEQEARVLAAVAQISPVRVPEPRFIDAGQGCIAYLKLPGVPLQDLPAARRAEYGPDVADTLGDLLNVLHELPVEQFAALVETDDQPLDGWLSDTAAFYATVSAAVPPAHHPAIEAFLAAAPPKADYTPVFSHNDLGIEHVLVDPETGIVTGVIDWGDAAIVDPAYDFGLIYRDLGPAALDAALRHYRPPGTDDLAALRDRAAFYARCSVFEDLAYGLDLDRPAYVEKCLTALAWLF